MEMFDEHLMEALGVGPWSSIDPQSVSEMRAFELWYLSEPWGGAQDDSGAEDSSRNSAPGDVLDTMAERQLILEGLGASDEQEHAGAASAPATSPARSPRVEPASRKRAALQPIPEPKQFKNWKNATPSKYCHACGVVSRADKAVCANISTGTCRKVFCRSCIEKIYGHFGPEHRGQSWECTHCTGACPVKATCRYYARRNSQRHSKKARRAAG